MAAKTTSRRGFGRRGADAPTRRNAAPRVSVPDAVEFRYNARLSYAGLLILVPLVDFFIGFSASAAAPDGPVAMGGPPAEWERMLFSLAPVLVGALGLFWLVQGLRGGLALRIAPEGVSASTFYGRASHEWDNVGRIAILEKPGGLRMQILKAFGAETGTMSTTLTIYPKMTFSQWFRTPIEVRVCNADGTLEEMRAAIARYCPDLVSG